MFIVGHHKPGHVVQPTPVQTPPQTPVRPASPQTEPKVVSALSQGDKIAIKHYQDTSPSRLRMDILTGEQNGKKPWTSLGAGTGAGALVAAGSGAALKLFAHRGITALPGAAAASGASMLPAALMGSMMGVVGEDRAQGMKYGAAIGALYGFTIAGTLGNAMGAGSVAKGLLTVGAWMGVGAISGAVGAATAGHFVQYEH
ncbi:MAG: hypothetical protein ACO1RX_12945 [Candidatus Sericytochromatia bacterium]